MTGFFPVWFLQSPRHAAVAPLLVSGGLLLGALAFQYLGGLPPCALCIDQRYAHGAAIVLAVLGLILRGRIGWTLVALAGAAMIVSGGIGVFHVGVEQKWWAGPSGCSAGGLTGLDPAEAAKRLMETPVVRCDEIAWALLGISMAGWNAIISVVVGAAVAFLGFARMRHA